MCIAIVQRKKKPLTDDRMEICWDRNPDGGGLGWRDATGKLHIFKSLDKKEFFKKYKALSKDKTIQYPILIHMRVKTSGLINLENCHPFWVTKGMIFMHNGMIRNVTPTTEMSDTRVFNEEVFKPIVSVWKGSLENEAIQKLVTQFIGQSRVVTLDSKGTVLIFNGKTGHEEEDGNWYSNKTYEPFTKRYSHSRGSHYASSHNNRTPNHGGNTVRSLDNGVFYYQNNKRRYIDGKMFQWCKNGVGTVELWRQIDSITGNFIPYGTTMNDLAADTSYNLWKKRYEDKVDANVAAIQKKREEDNLLLTDNAGKVIDLSERLSRTDFPCEFCNQSVPDKEMVLISIIKERDTDDDLVYSICSECHKGIIENWGTSTFEVLIGSSSPEKIKEVLH